MGGTERLVHIHGGRHLLDRLAAAGVPGQRLEWNDPVCSGPTPAGLTADAWYQTRADHLAGMPGAPDAATIAADLRAQDAALSAIPADHEIVIWSGAELYCQAITMRLLATVGARPGPLSLVEADRPGQPCPLGALTPSQLNDAFAARRPLDAVAAALARRAWAAFTAPDAGPLLALRSVDTSALPFLRDALERHLADLPDGGTGLSTTETRILETLSAGPLALAPLLAALASREQRPWHTDSIVALTLRRLAQNQPLVEEQQGAWALTRRGRDVLAGYEVWRAQRWLGGMFITGRDDDDPDDDDADAPVN